ncbi:hypothetical protein [Desulfogranum marinum]|uniref:hypothetical protein n=1 Tax=Desulfogranum marinum TaxID=453220 RepID=UPI0029C96060|nr:hypothetical protein [Desulfogranum marinum]
MSDIFTSSTFLATVTFLWYRKGRLWNFYDSLAIKSQKQITESSIDREQWEQIALEQCNKLSKEMFNSLFRFEIEYLKGKILANQYSLWVTDSLNTNGAQTTITDKEKYCRHVLKQIFLADFRFCGFGLLINSIKFKASHQKDKDPGYEEILKKK